MKDKCPYCEGKGYIVGHGAFGEREETPCYRCIYVKQTLVAVITILHSEYIEYKSTEEHDRMQNYAKRLEQKLKEIQ